MSKPTIQAKPAGKPLPAKKQKIAKGQQFATAAATDEPPRMRFNANIRTDLHRRLKIYAAIQGLGMGEVLEKFLETLPEQK